VAFRGPTLVFVQYIAS